MTLTTMRAIVQQGYGGVEVLSVAERPVPHVGPKQVLVQVHAVSPDSGTVHLMTGRPSILRPFVGWRTPRQPIIGLAFAGIVRAVGAAVEGFAVGDRVAGSAPAAFAEFVVASPAKLAQVPTQVSMSDAATLPISASTALQALRDAAKVESGHTVAIIGAGGGVGSFLTQLAVLDGARVTAIASAAKAAFVRTLGAERVIDYRALTDPREWGVFDVVIDTADGRPLSVLRRALAERGTLVIVGADGAGGPVLDGLERQMGAMLLNPWVRHRLTSIVQAERASDLQLLLDHLSAGRLRAPVADIVPLDDAVVAIESLQRQLVAGKVVIELRTETAGSSGRPGPVSRSAR